MSPRERSLSDAIDCESSVSAADSHECERKPMVTFGVIEIREYNQVVGDHPDVTSGPPVALGWEFAEQMAVPVDDYEITRLRRHRTTPMRTSGIDRKELLLYEFGIPEEEVRSAEKEVQRIRSQRESTLNKQPTVQIKVETKLKRLRRKITKNLLPSLAASAKVMAPSMMLM